MSRIDKALERAGLVPKTENPASEAAQQKELISAWDLGDSEETSATQSKTQGTPPPVEPGPQRGRSALITPTDAPLPETDQRPSPLSDAPAPTGVRTDEDFPGLSTAIDKSFEDKLVAMPNMEFQSVEQFRRLAAMLHLMQGNHKLKTVLVTSALPAEGKTLTASNLALCLSGSYRRRVLLIDCDLRRPTVNELFDVPGASGLTEWLRHTSPEGPSIHKVSRNLSILPAGRPDPDPMGVLTSDRMRELVEQASDTVDWIVLDSPPVGLLSDGHLLSAMADAVVLVVRAGHTPYADIEKAVEALGRDRIAGVVLNQVEGTKVPGKYSYNSYSNSYTVKQPVLEA